MAPSIIMKTLRSLPDRAVVRLKRKAASEGRSIVTVLRHEHMCWYYAFHDQGFEGDLAEWLCLPADEREAYELGAQGYSS